MGEYAIFKGQRVKIGTCENLTDMRAEHVDQITGYSFGRSVLAGVRFRFPFPEEDGMEPGRVDADVDLDKALNVPGADFDHRTYDHGTIHLAASGGPHPSTANSTRVSFPCPLGPRGSAVVEAAELRFFGVPRGVNIVQQRAWEGRLVLVAECPACGNRFRLPTLEDVAPILNAVDQQADAYAHDATLAANRADMWRANVARDEATPNSPNAEYLDHWRRRATDEDSDARRNEERAVYWRTVADRIRAGYTDPPAFVAVTAPADATA